MPVFRAKMTLGGKLSICLLATVTPVALFDACAGRGRVAEWVLRSVGFPLLYIPGLVERLHLFEKTDWEWVPRWFLLLMHILLWVGSCYIWGNVLAAGVWLIRPLLGKDDDEPVEGGQ
jgi:hypothetical protein